MECIVDHSGHEFVRKEESSKYLSKNLNLILVYILKENGERVVRNLEQLSRRAQILMEQGNALRYDVKSRKIEVLTQIDENFEKIIRQVLKKKAEVKLKYVEALQVEEARIQRE